VEAPQPLANRHSGRLTAGRMSPAIAFSKTHPPVRAQRTINEATPKSGPARCPKQAPPRLSRGDPGRTLCALSLRRHCDGARGSVSQGESDSAVGQHRMPKRLTDSSRRATPSRITPSACHRRGQPRLRAVMASQRPRGPSFPVTCQPPIWRSRAALAADHPAPSGLTLAGPGSRGRRGRSGCVGGCHAHVNGL
jgi:hypothetical protein